MSANGTLLAITLGGSVEVRATFKVDPVGATAFAQREGATPVVTVPLTQDPSNPRLYTGVFQPSAAGAWYVLVKGADDATREVRLVVRQPKVTAP